MAASDMTSPLINEAEEPAPSTAPDKPTSSPERVVEEQVSSEISQQPRRLSVSSTEEDRGKELTTVRENNPVPKALIIGDSMIKGINENRLSRSLIVLKVYVRGGTKETLEYLKSLDDNVVYESVFIHTGTNDIRILIFRSTCVKWEPLAALGFNHCPMLMLMGIRWGVLLTLLVLSKFEFLAKLEE
ncbi:predicted protein [Nematostella vectensis]|uniref:Uncharacterized protein n=1 Tax=Nematostella vectensis TaxID=45351 RepID=A7STT8_NEMVE|nr:predicted protein [Nematostella vectensis]|eukprot:XP_001624966.1 predicted protein [Nematostella vectensis]